MNSGDIARDVIESASYVFLANKKWADKAIAQVDDDKLRVALDPETNSIAVIMKHVAGNLLSRWTDFLTTDGEKSWRNRDDEFVDTFKNRQEILAYWEKGWACVVNALGQLEANDLSKTVEIRGTAHSVPSAIHRSLAHCGYHCGQIIMIARIMAGESWNTITIARGQSTAVNQRVWGNAHLHEQ